MAQVEMKAVGVLDARPEDVYATIADYRQAHPSILPQRNLYDLRVEQGGQGAGTVIRFKARVLGVEQAFYQRVSEPEPGRVLVEQDIDPAQNGSTTFTVIPVDQGQRSRVEIVSRRNASPGLRGVIERSIVPLVLQGAYRQELHLLEAAAQKRSASPRLPSPPAH